jgi:hypothetical protein
MVVVAVTVLILLPACRLASAQTASPLDGCLSCHTGIESISDFHRFPCTDCHGGNAAGASTEEAHRGLVSNPSALEHAPSRCGSCHPDQVSRVSRSLMATAAGLINQTRAAFGNQEMGEVLYAAVAVDASSLFKGASGEPFSPGSPGAGSVSKGMEPKARASLPNQRIQTATSSTEAPAAKAPEAWSKKTPDPDYSVNGYDSLRQVPEPTEETLVDDLLRRRCLRCHLHIPGASRTGDHHAEGCAACHMLYADDGATHTGDRAIRDTVRLSGGQGRAYPVRHRFTTRIPTRQCAHCHNGNRVGADYMGLFERDHHQSYRFLSPDGERFFPLYGLDHHRLLPDVHFERGLHCIDCHVQSELMGDGRIHGFSRQALKTTCRDCHGTPNTAPVAVEVASSDEGLLAPARVNPLVDLEPGDRVLGTARGERLPNVRLLSGDWVLFSKVTGKTHRIPLLKELPEQPVDHRIAEHLTNMTCHSCHAAWSFRDYGLHLFREDVPRYEKWRALWAQNDPQAQNLLAENLALDTDQWAVPRTRDYLSNEVRTGAWFSGWSLRRWEGRILGRGGDGRVRVFRPQYQYVVTWVDRQGRVRWNGRIPETRGRMPGLIMNPYAPHTIRKRVVRCEGCHLNPEAVGLGSPEFVEEGGRMTAVPLAAADGNPPGADFPLFRMVDLEGEILQPSTHPGARPFNGREIRRLLAASKIYRRIRLEDLGYITPDGEPDQESRQDQKSQGLP